MTNAINWFELPVRNLDRAERFYGELLAQPLQRQVFNGDAMAILPYREGQGVGGALIADARRKPSADGAVVYLHTPDLDAALARAGNAGGAIVMPKTDIGPHGFIALVRDTEGNVVGLHAAAG